MKGSLQRDPSDTGGLFLGRRPDSSDVPRSPNLRPYPEKKHKVTRIGLIAMMVLIGGSFWGPIPLVWLWIGSQVAYFTGQIALGLLIIFLGMLVTLIGGLTLLRWLDRLWLLRQTTHRSDGLATKIFAGGALFGGALFTIWFLFFGGLGPMLAPH